MTKKKESKSLISNSLYDKDGFLREKDEMLSLVPKAAEEIKEKHLSKEFHASYNGVLMSNLGQIQKGDLDYDSKPKTHFENGYETKYFGSSTLEGENSRINSLIRRCIGQEILSRILLIYSATVNIRQGVKYGRIPSGVLGADLLNLTKTAIYCRGNIQSTEEEEWIINLLSTVTLEDPILHHKKPAWELMNEIFSNKKKKNIIESSGLNGSINFFKDNLRKISIASSKRLTTNEFVKNLNYDTSTSTFSANEDLLLFFICQKITKINQTWSENILIITILYNLIVSSMENSSFLVSQKSMSHVSKKLASLPNDYIPQNSLRDNFKYFPSLKQQVKVNDKFNDLIRHKILILKFYRSKFRLILPHHCL